MKKRYYLLAGGLAYLVFLIAGIPASLVATQLNKRIPTISITGVNGSLWNGSAQSVIIKPQKRLDNLDWNTQIFRLLTGELSATIKTFYQQHEINADVGVTLFGNIVARNVQAQMNASDVAKLAQIPMAEFSGNIDLQLDNVQWQQHQVPLIKGTILWSDAAITVAEKAKLGTVSIKLSDDDSYPLTADINNEGGDIKLEGQANVSDDGRYVLELDMLPTSQASRNIRSSLGMFAKPQPNGGFRLSNNGNLKQFGLM